MLNVSTAVMMLALVAAAPDAGPPEKSRATAEPATGQRVEPPCAGPACPVPVPFPSTKTTDAPPETLALSDHSAVGNGLKKLNAVPAQIPLNGGSLDEILDQLPGLAGARTLDRNVSNAIEATRESHSMPRRPIYSTLPLDIPEFREIVESFVGCMDDTMKSLREAQARMDYQEVREIAHRLKGTGGTVGFAAYTEPSRKLQFAAEERDDETIEAMLVELEDISSRIEMPIEV